MLNKVNDMEQELQKMYDSEINVRIHSFWDSEWRVSIMVGSEWVVPENYTIVSLNEVIGALQDLIIKHLPDSNYAKELIQKKV